MTLQAAQGIFIPFIGTTLGAACVLFMKNKLNDKVRKALTGFAAVSYTHLTLPTT